MSIFNNILNSENSSNFLLSTIPQKPIGNSENFVLSKPPKKHKISKRPIGNSVNSDNVIVPTITKTPKISMTNEVNYVSPKKQFGLFSNTGDPVTTPNKSMANQKNALKGISYNIEASNKFNLNKLTDRINYIHFKTNKENLWSFYELTDSKPNLMRKLLEITDQYKKLPKKVYIKMTNNHYNDKEMTEEFNNVLNEYIINKYLFEQSKLNETDFYSDNIATPIQVLKLSPSDFIVNSYYYLIVNKAGISSVKKIFSNSNGNNKNSFLGDKYSNEFINHLLLSVAKGCRDLVRKYGILHLDLTNNNILKFDNNEKPFYKIMDFGTSVFIDDSNYINNIKLEDKKYKRLEEIILINEKEDLKLFVKEHDEFIDICYYIHKLITYLYEPNDTNEKPFIFKFFFDLIKKNTATYEIIQLFKYYFKTIDNFIIFIQQIDKLSNTEYNYEKVLRHLQLNFSSSFSSETKNVNTNRL